MKLADWPGGFEYPGVSEQIPARMAQLELTEDAALVATDETGNPRVLIAADGALLDCRYLGETGPGLEIVVMPWEAVPLPWIAYAWFGSSESSATMTFRLGLDPNVDVTYHESVDQDAARANLDDGARLNGLGAFKERQANRLRGVKVGGRSSLRYRCDPLGRPLTGPIAQHEASVYGACRLSAGAFTP